MRGSLCTGSNSDPNIYQFFSKTIGPSNLGPKKHKFCRIFVIFLYLESSQNFIKIFQNFKKTKFSNWAFLVYMGPYGKRLGSKSDPPVFLKNKHPRAKPPMDPSYQGDNPLWWSKFLGGHRPRLGGGPGTWTPLGLGTDQPVDFHGSKTKRHIWV